MKEVRIKSGFKDRVIVLYESVKELRITRHHELQKLILQDIGIGSTIDDVAGHFERFHTMLVNNRVDDAIAEAKNLHNNFYYMIEGVSIKSRCFAVLIHSINGKLFNELDESGVSLVLAEVSRLGLTNEMVERELSDLKKNLKRSWSPIFLMNTEREELPTLTLS